MVPIEHHLQVTGTLPLLLYPLPPKWIGLGCPHDPSLSCARVKSWFTLLQPGQNLLNPKLNYRMESPLQNPALDFSWEADECDVSINGKIGTAILVCQSKGTAPDLHSTLKACLPYNPTLFSALKQGF